MAAIANASWEEDLSFEIDLQGHRFKIDSDAEFGGKDRGPRPKALLLAGLAGCTGMDVASILGKMRMPWDSFRLEVDADSSKEHPVVYTDITVRYIFTGGELDRTKIEKAVKLSREKYCGVAAMLGKTAELHYEILLNP